MNHPQNRTDRTASTAARVIMALVDEDLDAAARVLAESYTTGGLGGLRNVALALGQMTADRLTPEAAADLVARHLDAEEARA